MSSPSAAPVRAPGSTSASHPVFRGDIDGLRALAIVIVVGFHVGLPGFSGGFVGVDVFFVISGFLITSVLLGEQTRTGRVGLLNFWARRIRRLVPALGLVVVSSLVMALLILPKVSMDEVARQSRAASLYLSNILYARDASDYFAVDSSSSPFLHTWSLGVEEQFYLFWPFLVLVVGVFTMRSAGLRSVAVGSFAVVAVGSFAISLHLTDTGSPWAFFGLQARLWELAAGGLLAAAPAALRSERPRARTTEAAIGIALILIATVALTDGTPFPGAAALLPVVGAMLVIHAGHPSVRPEHLPVSRTLAWDPLQYVGRLSYSWYLWHWPLIVFATVQFEDRLIVKLAAAFVALGVASAAYRWVECPVRFSPALGRSLPKTYLMGAVVTLVAIGVSFAVVRGSEATETDLDEELRSAREGRRGHDCVEMESPTGILYCESGDIESETTILLVGDSFARHWKSALAEASAAEGVRLIDRFRPICPTVDLTIAIDDMAECDIFREESDRLIEELGVEVVVLSNSGNYTKGLNPFDDPEYDVSGQWAEALGLQIDGLIGRGIGAAVIRATPVYEDDPVECVSAERDFDACSAPRSEVLHLISQVRAGATEVLDARPAVPVFSVIDLLCDQEQCMVAVDGVLAYSDKGHLSPNFTATQAGRLRDFVREMTEAQAELASAG